LPNSDPRAPTAYIALGVLGDVRLETGAAYIYRENNQRFVPLKYSVRGRDLGSTVAEAQQRIGDRVKLPEGYKLDWTGEFGALVEAQKRLAIIVPLSLLLISCCSTACSLRSRDSLLALSGIPFAVAGGILGLTSRAEFQHLGRHRIHLACSASRRWTAFCCVLHPQELHERHRHREAIITASQTRMRQIFMTGLSACYRPRAGGVLDRHRSAGAAAAGLRDRRRHAAVADLQPARDPDAGAHLHAVRAGPFPVTRRRLPVLSKRKSPRPPLRIARAVGSRSLKQDRGHGCRPDLAMN
jgi:hypothetical protein